MEVLKCDVCGVTSDKEAFAPWAGNWRSLTVRRKKDWHVTYTHLGGNAMQEGDDSWPGARVWNEPVMPERVPTLHLCSEGCMFDALAKLHDGSEVVAFSGFGIRTEDLLALMREGVAATQEP